MCYLSRRRSSSPPSPPRLVTDEDRHRQVQRSILIAEHDERLMEQWREQFPDDVQVTEDFYPAKMEERRVDRRRREDFINAELERQVCPHSTRRTRGGMMHGLRPPPMTSRFY
jgi:hypothetical protein